MSRPNLIIILLLIFIAIILLLKQPFITLDSNKLVAVLGLIITAIAFAVGGCFAFMALNTYARFKEIDRAEKVISRVKDDVKRIKNDSVKACEDQLNSLDDFLTHQISLTFGPFPHHSAEEYIGYFQERRVELYKTRGLISLKYKAINTYQRQKRIRELKAFMDEHVAAALRKARNDETELREIRELADEILQK